MVLTLEMLSHPLFLEDTLLLVRTYDRTKFSDVAVLFLSSLLRKFKELIVVGNTAKPPISNHPKWEELMVAYGRWLLMRIKPQGVSSNKRFGLIYSSKDDLMHAISKLQCMYVQFYVVIKSSLHIPWVHSFGMTHLMISDLRSLRSHASKKVMNSLKATIYWFLWCTWI